MKYKINSRLFTPNICQKINIEETCTVFIKKEKVILRNFGSVKYKITLRSFLFFQMCKYVRERRASSVRGEREEGVAVRLSGFTASTSVTTSVGVGSPRRNYRLQQRQRQRPRGRRRRRCEQEETKTSSTQDPCEVCQSWRCPGDNPFSMAVHRLTTR